MKLKLQKISIKKTNKVRYTLLLDISDTTYEYVEDIVDVMVTDNSEVIYRDDIYDLFIDRVARCFVKCGDVLDIIDIENVINVNGKLEVIFNQNQENEIREFLLCLEQNLEEFRDVFINTYNGDIEYKIPAIKD